MCSMKSNAHFCKVSICTISSTINITEWIKVFCNQKKHVLFKLQYETLRRWVQFGVGNLTGKKQKMSQWLTRLGDDKWCLPFSIISRHSFWIRKVLFLRFSISKTESPSEVPSCHKWPRWSPRWGHTAGCLGCVREKGQPSGLCAALRRPAAGWGAAPPPTGHTVSAGGSGLSSAAAPVPLASGAVALLPEASGWESLLCGDAQLLTSLGGPGLLWSSSPSIPVGTGLLDASAPFAHQTASVLQKPSQRGLAPSSPAPPASASASPLLSFCKPAHTSRCSLPLWPPGGTEVP